ncbi:hypothetical protein [Pseudomonas sp. PDM13]|uniref:hypothetical protein n=1 Tax=Pseudomonas sp. PDM13 TaxID=2769255 RepID=UPI0021DF5DF5|nr:hypothetical protein [Pseudomonas sp. PDM13]MCU9948262.1 hypothetical protein [Pseudomonas sp. PDM13]MCU9948277.1 hypothetical protein [Pseudomonas sp. PDM13]
MARNSGIRRLGLRWGFGICILCASVTAFGATRQNVTIPNNTDITAPGRAVATKGSGVVHVAAQEGEYIAASNLNKRVPVKVLKTVDYSIPRTINQAKGILKGNLANLVVGGLIAGGVAAVGWVMDEGTKTVKKPVPETMYEPITNTGWCMGTYSSCQSPTGTADTRAATATGSAALVLKDFQSFQDHPTWHNGAHYEIISCEPNYCQMALVGGQGGYWTFSVHKYGNCDSWESGPGGGCPSKDPQYVPVTDADLDSTFTDYANGQGADWLKGLIRESCAGSSNPEGCMQSLRDNVTTSGPATVSGGTTTTTGTYLKPDGTYGSTRTDITTNYNIKYGPTYFDYTENKTSTSYKDGEKTSEETTTDDEEVTDDKPAEEEDKEVADPCLSGCDGPAYQDMYSPSDKTKEDEIDSYSSRVKNIPIMKAVVGLFDVDAGSSACPVWETHTEAQIWGHMFQIDLVFDYHCLPWFVDLRMFVQAIVMIGFAYVAIRIGLL